MRQKDSRKNEDSERLGPRVNKPILIFQSKDDINITAGSGTNISPEELSVWDAIPLERNELIISAGDKRRLCHYLIV